MCDTFIIMETSFHIDEFLTEKFETKISNCKQNYLGLSRNKASSSRQLFLEETKMTNETRDQQFNDIIFYCAIELRANIFLVFLGKFSLKNKKIITSKSYCVCEN